MMKLKFRSLESRIVFDGDDLSCEKDSSSTTESTALPEEDIEITPPIPQTLSNPETARYNHSSPLHVKKGNAYYGQDVFYTGNLEAIEFKTLKIIYLPSNPRNSFQGNSFYSTILQSRIGPVEIHAIYPYSQGLLDIPITIQSDFFSHSIKNLKLASEIMDMILHKASEIVLSEIQTTTASRVGFFIQTKSIFRYCKKLSYQNINTIHYQILPAFIQNNTSGINVLMFDISIAETKNRENSSFNDEGPLQIKRENAYHAQGLFYRSDIKNKDFKKLLIRTNSNPANLVQHNYFYSRIIQSRVGPMEFYAVYRDGQNSIDVPITIRNNFFSHSFENMKIVLEVIDTILYQSSEIILSEIEITRPQRMEFLIETDSIFHYSEALQQQNISTIHYQILPHNFYDRRSAHSVSFFQCSITRIQNSRPI